jgi:Holliday junction resolvase RusA-like endonuclease
MIRIDLKPLSLNHAYIGRRWSTPTLRLYKESIHYLAPTLTVPTGKLKASYRFGVSSKGADVDNLVKCLQDALANKYKFNDRKIYKINIEKVDVKKGEEFIEFEILPL